MIPQIRFLQRAIFTSASFRNMSKSALIIGSDGSEEMELVITGDVLRRAGIDVTVAGLQDKEKIVCSRKFTITVDALLKDIVDKEFDAVILPGGQPGSNNLAQDARVGEILKHHEKAGKVVAAICAAPLAFKAHDIASGGSITSYPSVKEKLTGYDYVEDRVHVWKNVITSRGPGTAFDFALKIVETLVDAKTANEVRAAMLLQ